MESKQTLVIAHRGARSLAPENTLLAAQKGLEAGADLWELDVAVTAGGSEAGGELVLMHDDSLSRTTNARLAYPEREPWNVWDFTLEEIQKLDAGTWFVENDPFDQFRSGNVPAEDRQAFAGLRVPTLQQALEFTREHQWRVNVELKDQYDPARGRTLVEKTAVLVSELGMDAGRQVVISSFNHEYLRQIHQINLKLPVQALVNERLEDLRDYLHSLRAEAVNPRFGLWSDTEIAELEHQGIHFNVYTVNDEPSMKTLVQAGVSGIFTDYPQVLRGLL